MNINFNLLRKKNGTHILMSITFNGIRIQTTINLNSNLNLTHLYCENNNLGTINLSQNFYLRELWLRYNSLTDLDFRNGNNTYLNNFKLRYNPYLYCIDVDNVTYSSNNWLHIDAQSFFSEDCGVK